MPARTRHICAQIMADLTALLAIHIRQGPGIYGDAEPLISRNYGLRSRPPIGMRVSA